MNNITSFKKLKPVISSHQAGYDQASDRYKLRNDLVCLSKEITKQNYFIAPVKLCSRLSVTV